VSIDGKIKDIEKLTGPDNKYWICGHDVGRLLYEKVIKIQAENVLEIGTSVGYSALWIAKALQGGDGHLFTVESHRERGALAVKHFEETGVFDIVTLIKGHAPEVLLEVAALEGVMFDLVFFDATKSEHLSYFDAVYPRLKKGGVLVVDNVISHGDGAMMRKFLNVVAGHIGMTSEILNVGSGVLVGSKL